MIRFHFLADVLSFSGGGAQLSLRLESLTALGVLLGSTTKIGLIAMALTTYTEPFNLVRQLTSLDHISNGHMG